MSFKPKSSTLYPSAELDTGVSAIPDHIAIIMDGNNRWAKKRFLPGAAGHRAGAKLLRPIAEACVDHGVTNLTVFAFSTENWHRPSGEVSVLMDLMRYVMKNDINDLHAKGVRLRIIGDRSRFAPDICAMMVQCENLTKDNTELNMSVAVNFGGRWDITMAAKALAQRVERGELSSADINEEMLASHLSLSEVGEPDLLIRTGGDHRVSNFLLWDLAYTEMYFTDLFWPEFDADQLRIAIDGYAVRQRRFGRRQ
jgi:undecaprenyl diphosphate synthase